MSNNDTNIIKILNSLLEEIETIENLEWLILVITKCGFLSQAKKFINIFDLKAFNKD